MEAICQHTRSEVIARRDGVDYVRCMDCHQIYEAEDLEAVPVYDDEETPTNGKNGHAAALKLRPGAKSHRK